MNDRILELFHHGIDKQRWGVRNGPPYPLNQKVHNRVVSGKQDKALKELDESSVGETTGYGGYTRRSGVMRPSYSYHSGLDTSRSYTVTEYKNGESTGRSISDLLASNSNYMQSLRTLSNHGKISGEQDLSSTNPLLKKYKEYEEKIMYGKIDYEDEGAYPLELGVGASNNCLKCTSTLALRAKGYDVTAGLAPGGMLSSSTEKYWDGARSYKENSVRNAEQRLMSFGNKGMGEIKIRRKEGNGHSMFFQNEKQSDGRWRPVVYDGQTGEQVGSLSEALERECHDFSDFLDIVRLDDATPNFKNMARDSVFVPNRGSFGLNNPNKDARKQMATYWNF